LAGLTLAPGELAKFLRTMKPTEYLLKIENMMIEVEQSKN
jgi:hypothetical protein